MLKRIILMSSALFLISTHAFASGFFSKSSAEDAQAIFDRADNTLTGIYYKSQRSIQAVQILPAIKPAQHQFPANQSCIKLYSCDKSICLVGSNNIKYAVSEALFKQRTQRQTKIDQCSDSRSVLAGKQMSNTQPVKVINVKSNDSLNVRTKPSYKSKKAGVLAFNSRCVQRLSCQKSWCKIQHKGLTGWVHNRYLAPLSSQQANNC